MGYFAPCLAYGRANLHTIVGQALAGDTTIQMSACPYAVGDLVFLQSVSGVDIEFLGAVKSVAADGKSFVPENPVFLDHLIVASPIWSPAAFVRFGQGPGWSWSKRFVPGVRTRVARGGQVFGTQTADPYWVFEFSFEKRAASDFQAVVDFLADHRSNGRTPFTLAFWDHIAARPVVCIVRIDCGSGVDEGGAGPGGPVGLAGEVQPGGSATYSLRFIASSVVTTTLLDSYQLT